MAGVTPESTSQATAGRPGRPPSETDPRRALGAAGEALAAAHLVRLGFKITDRNYRTRWGELDIVACDGRHLVFCEVKCRRARSDTTRDPIESVGPRKQLQVRRMAARWLVERQNRPRALELRFDVIGVTLDHQDQLVRLDHLEGAF